MLCVQILTAAVLAAVPVLGHVTPKPDVLLTDSFVGQSCLRIGHGCESEDASGDHFGTLRVSILVPKTVWEVSPMLVPGWTVDVVRVPLLYPNGSTPRIGGEVSSFCRSALSFSLQANLVRALPCNVF
jgi:uncharacterized protein YcnI